MHLQPGEWDPTQNLPLITVEFLLDENITHFEVERTALSEICAYTGGFIFFIYIITKFLIGWIAEQNLTRRIVKRVFLYDGIYSGESSKSKVFNEN